MAKNRLADLRDHLFETLEALKDREKPMDLDRARTVGEVAQTMINLAKVEVDMARVADGRGMEGVFFSVPEESREVPRIALPVRPPVKEGFKK